MLLFLLYCVQRKQQTYLSANNNYFLRTRTWNSSFSAKYYPVTLIDKNFIFFPCSQNIIFIIIIIIIIIIILLFFTLLINTNVKQHDS